MKSGQLDRRERGALWIRLGIRLTLTALALWFLFRFGRRTLSLFAPFLAAAGAAALLNAPIQWLQRKLNWSRRAAALVLLLALLAVLGTALGLLLWAAARELLALMQERDNLLAALQDGLARTQLLFARFLHLLPPRLLSPVRSAADELLLWLAQAVPDALTRLFSSLGHWAMAVPSLLVSLLVFVTATYFLAADGPRQHGDSPWDAGILRFFWQLRLSTRGAFGGYLKAQLFLSIGVFFILLAGFLITRQPYSLLLALGLALLDLIPLVGAGTVMLPWAFLALFSRDVPTAVEVMLIWVAVALFRRTMEPKFVGDRTGLSPLLSLVSIYVGMKLAGVAGMILAPIGLLIVLNLADMGLFRGFALDLYAAVRDVAAILSKRPFQA